MKSINALAIAALASMAQAVEFTNSNFNLAGQSTFTFTWSGADGPVSLILKNGPTSNLQTVQTITTGQTGDSFTWSIPTNLPSGTYAVEIEDSSGVPNFSMQFTLTGTGTASISGTSTTGSTTASTASSTTASSSTSVTTSSSSSTTSTSTTKTSSHTSSSPTASQTTSVPGSGSPGRLSSPLAFILVSVAAMFYFQ